MGEPTLRKDIGVYTQRAYLTIPYLRMFGGVISYNDSNAPLYPVFYTETPEGQLSFHSDPEDLHIFNRYKVPVVEDYPWDGHTTETKFQRIQRLNDRIPHLWGPKTKHLHCPGCTAEH